MTNVLTLSRRALVAAVLAVGLALMHGGPGQALACNGMSAAATKAKHQHGSQMPARDPMASGRHAQHHQPVDQPKGLSSPDQCLATPSSPSSGGSKVGPAASAALPRQPQADSRCLLSDYVSPELAAPDLVSVLCVNRR
jgi:hypothetical protein